MVRGTIDTNELEFEFLRLLQNCKNGKCILAYTRDFLGALITGTNAQPFLKLLLKEKLGFHKKEEKNNLLRNFIDFL